MFCFFVLYCYLIKFFVVEFLECVVFDVLGVVGDRCWMVVDIEIGCFFI